MTNQSQRTPVKGSQTILVVDDDPSMALLCRTKLEQTGFTVLEASGSSEALKVCSEYPGQIDLLLIDLLLPPPGFSLAPASNQFPRVHGHLLVERLVAIKKGVRVLLMSALSDQELNDRDISVGNLPFIRKPFTMEALLEKMRDVLAAPPSVVAKKDAKDKETDQKDVHWYD
ncbi:MAG: response regulator [Nitrospiraceae bacterium]